MNIFIGLFFSFVIASSDPVFKNSSYFCIIVLPIFGNFNAFKSLADPISVIFADDIYFLSSFIALIYAIDRKTSPLAFIIDESSFRAFIKFIMLLPPNIL